MGVVTVKRSDYIETFNQLKGEVHRQLVSGLDLATIHQVSEDQIRDVASFMDATRAAFEEAQEPVALVVWPETMLPGAGLEAETVEVLKSLGPEVAVLHRFGEELVALSRELGAPILTGSPTWVEPFIDQTPDGQRWAWRYEYNSAYLIQGTPPYQRYDKHFLTPFGETMPYISAWPWLEARLLDIGARGMAFDLDAAPVIRRLVLEWTPLPGASGPKADEPRASLTIATPICFEDTVARVCRKMIWRDRVKMADLFINLSNDGWFGNHDAGRQQHAQAARYRCIENRVPMIRAVNTGLSVAVDSNGVLGGVVGEGRYGAARRPGWLRTELRLDARRTLYGIVGEAWAWACLAATGALVGWTVFANKRETRSQ